MPVRKRSDWNTVVANVDRSFPESALRKIEVTRTKIMIVVELNDSIRISELLEEAQGEIEALRYGLEELMDDVKRAKKVEGEDE